VVVAIAMEAEAMPFVEYLGLKLEENFFPSQAPFQAYSGNHNKCQITVVTNGKDTVYGAGVDNVGTVPASTATFMTLSKIGKDVDLVINAGTCGGFKAKGAEIGDVFLTTASANHDRRIAIPGFVEYGVGLIQSTNTENLAASINAKHGICTTSNSLDHNEDDDKLMLSNDASVKDMEAAAIAWSCKLFDIPHFGVKVVTDIVDGDRPSHEEFLENLGSAAKSLQAALPKIIDEVCGKGHEEL